MFKAQMIHPKTNYTALQELLDQGSTYLNWSADTLFVVKPDLSGWSIGEHLYHITLANASIPKLIERLKAGTLGNEEDQPKPEQVGILEQGYIPAGRDAPKRVVPPAELNSELLNRDFNRMRAATQRIEPLLDELATINRRFPHMFFGPLSATEWVRFMEVHTRHHMNIIEKIAE